MRPTDNQESERVNCQRETACSTLTEFELIDKLATMLGISGPESEEMRNTSITYQRRVLRAAIVALEKTWQNKA